MNWLKRVLTPRVAPPAVEQPAESADPDEWLRAGYDCECAGDAAGAEVFYRRAIEHDPTHSEAHYFLGRIAHWDRRYDEAIALFQTAAGLCPDEATYQCELGNVFRAVLRYPESLERLNACLALLPHCVDARINRAVALIEVNYQPGARVVELNLQEQARVELERLRELLPDQPEILFNLAGIYREYGRTEEAIAAYRRIRELSPGYAPAYSNLLLMLHYSTLQDARSIFEEHRRFGEAFSRRYVTPRPERAGGRRLRVGYVSPDFRGHVVSYFMEPVLANHDRGRFEIFCYHTHAEKDGVTARLRGHVEHWLDCEELTADELAERIRADRIDILVDLAGHTAGNPMMVFAMKPAPVQVTWLGYPDTTGLGAVDYRLTDTQADPPGESDGLSIERLVRLPASYYCYRPPARVPDVTALPAAATEAVTFGCFNNFHKISGAFLDAVARVLHAVPGSHFLLKGRPLSVPEVAQTVRERFERTGIGAERIELRGWEAGFKDHLAIYSAVDIALDSFPYNGGTTTCEALWMGVPVVTVAGDRHVSRMGASLLSAVGLDELIARDIDGLVAICVRLASDAGRLAELRRTLRDRMRRSPLMNEPAFARALERSYLEMWESAVSRYAETPDAAGDTPVPALLESARRSRDAGDLTQTEAACLEILRRQPDHAEALTLLWNLGFDTGRPGASTEWLLKAISADGGVAAFHHMLGCVLQAQGKVFDAIASFRRALELDPAMAKAHNNLGCLFEVTGGLDEAARCYRSAIASDPALAEAFYNLGNVCKRLGDPSQAIEHISRALALDPRHADWRCNLAELHHERLELDEAIASYEAALDIDTASELAYKGLGAALAATGRLDQADVATQKAIESKSRNADAEARQLLLLHYRGSEDPETVSARHVTWAHRYPRGLVRMTAHPRLGAGAGRRLNIGYLLPDLRSRPIASFIEPVLASHDRSAFDVTVYTNWQHEDEAARRLRGHGWWHDLSAMSDHDAAHRVRADGIDVLVDLAGHYPGGRLMMLGSKPAAVQAAWLGYPGTTGLDAMDYRLTDAVADPEGEAERLYTEQLVRLPHLLCYAPPPESPDVDDPSAAGTGQVTFGCFGNLAKVTTRTIALWSELLRALPESRMMLKNHGLSAQSARRALLEQFHAHGIAAERLELQAAGQPLAEHLARYREVDIALDVFPYNGMVTTCEALWMGVPVVTLAGKSHATRIGASILDSAGLPEFVAETSRDFVEIGLRLAAAGDHRRALRSEMRDRLRGSPLLDAAGFTRGLEAAYHRIWYASRAHAVAKLTSTGTDDD